MTEHSADYKRRIASASWKALRKRLIVERGFRCERCLAEFAGMSPSLELHHITYERLGRERDSDLVVVCVNCHPGADKERAHRVECEAFDRRMDGWARKKYGEDWYASHDDQDVYEEFCAWLEDHEYD